MFVITGCLFSMLADAVNWHRRHNENLLLAAGKGEVQRQESGEYVFVLRLTYSGHAELIPFNDEL